MKVCRIWIFNIGRGFAAVIKTPGEHWITIDLGTSEEFNPTADFLVPKLAKGRAKMTDDGRLEIAQAIITHPHDDHLTGIMDFHKNIYPKLLTVPNDVSHPNQPEGGKVNWKLIKNPSEELTKYLRNRMFAKRQPPLVATESDTTSKFRFKISYLLPAVCESDEQTLEENYANNISIMVYLNYRGNSVLFCGDMMKDGMKKLLDTDSNLCKLLSEGIGFLVAPHHGLRSSFSTDLFSAMRGGKTRCLNIISERPTRKDSSEKVDTRYGQEDYCAGESGITTEDGKIIRHLRTSAAGHILLSFYENTVFTIHCDDEALAY